MNQEINGELENTRCSEIIKILSLGKRTGRLMLNNGAETGNIFFQDGDPIHAQCGPIEGNKAIYEMAVWTSGEYRFYVDDTPDVITVNSSSEEILNEATIRIRQMDRVSSLISSSSMVYTLDADINDKEITLKSIQWKVIAHINGKRSITDIAQIVGLTVSDTLKVFYTLIKLGLLREADNSDAVRQKTKVELPGTPFVNALNSDFTKAIGPIASFIIAETAEDMGFDLLSDDVDHRAAFIETLSSKIIDEDMALYFLNTMTDWLKSGAIH